MRPRALRELRLALALLVCAWLGHDDAILTAKPHRCRRCGLMVTWLEGEQTLV